MTSNELRKCICEHVEAHHRQSGPLNPLSLTRCEWSGCGCPRFIQAPESEPPVLKTSPSFTVREYELVKENSVINERFLERGALKWLDSPVPIYSTDFMKIVGTIKSIRREGNIVYGTSYDFFEDVNLSVEITHIMAERTATSELTHITEGLIRSVVIARDAYVRAE